MEKHKTQFLLLKILLKQRQRIKSNKEIIIPDSEVVPGDIIILQEGEKIPADAK
jgi:magnesium-transporting ATPase (P-type)